MAANPRLIVNESYGFVGQPYMGIIRGTLTWMMPPPEIRLGLLNLKGFLADFTDSTDSADLVALLPMVFMSFACPIRNCRHLSRGHMACHRAGLRK